MKIKEYFIAFVLILLIAASVSVHAEKSVQSEDILAHRTISLEARYRNAFVNSVFEDNILLTLAYLHGRVKNSTPIKWDTLHKPFSFELTLEPGRTFAYHDQILPQYDGKVAFSTHAHFNGTEGFRSDGYLMGDGVCHLASLINWVAQEAGLQAEAPVNHDFANIPQVPKKYGVAIYTVPGQPSASAEQNLYVTNNRQNPVKLKFDFDGTNLTFSVVKAKGTLVRVFN